MNSERSKPKSFSRLESLVWIQRSLRLLVRALWFGMSGWLLSWSASKFWNWPESQQSWLIIACCVAAVTLFFIPIRKPSLNKLVWTFDRLFSLKEQFSTGYQVMKSSDVHQIHNALLMDIDLLSFPYIQKVRKKGWRLIPDILSLMVVIGLFIMVYQKEFSIADIPGYQPNSDHIKIIPLGEDPALLTLYQIDMEPDQVVSEVDNYKQSMSGNDQDLSSYTNQWSGDTNDYVTSQMLNSLFESMKDMGGNLKSDASTFEISQGLMSGDLEETADAIEQLADHLDQLANDTRKEISETLTEQAEKLAKMEMEKASIELKEAADAIDNTISEDSEPRNLMVPSDSKNPEYYQGYFVLAQEKLDQIAQSLREISDQLDDQLSNNNSDGAGIETVKFNAGTVISNQSKSSPQEINRLESITGEFQFNSGYDSGSPIIGNPGDTDDVSEEQIGINQSAYTLSDNYFINYIVPYYYPWKWHNVVSKYFQRN